MKRRNEREKRKRERIARMFREFFTRYSYLSPCELIDFQSFPAPQLTQRTGISRIVDIEARERKRYLNLWMRIKYSREGEFRLEIWTFLCWR